MKPPTVGSLFSGCGGFDLGFDAAGFDLRWQVEIDPTARDVLARHWPGTARHEDVRAVGKRNLEPVDVVVGGFPCQDLSTAGKRGGFGKGERSVLFFEMARVIRELRPAYVCWENVPGLLTSAEGRDFLAVLVELDRLGFDGGWRTVDAQFFGVPQQRRRVFGVFARRRLGAGRAAEVLALAEGGRRRTPKGRRAGQGVAAPAAGNPGDIGGTPAVYGGGDTRGERRVAATLSAKGLEGLHNFDSENFVLIQDARDLASKGQGGLGVRVSSVSYTLDTLGAQAVCVGCLAPDATPKGRADGLAYTLTGRQQRGHGNGMAVAFAENQRGEVRFVDPPPAVTCGGGKPGEGYPAALVGTTVRRLTPRECERLMGWPDDHTRFRADGREIKDGPRYRMCGNGVVGTVAAWLAKRLRTFGFPEGKG